MGPGQYKHNITKGAAWFYTPLEHYSRVGIAHRMFNQCHLLSWRTMPALRNYINRLSFVGWALPTDCSINATCCAGGQCPPYNSSYPRHENHSHLAKINTNTLF